MGDAAAKNDLDAALKQDPAIAAAYAKLGIAP